MEEKQNVDTLNPTAEQAFKEICEIVQNCKATKAEHVYLEKCLLALGRAAFKKVTEEQNEVQHDA